MSQIEIETFFRRIQRFRHAQTIKELTKALENSGLFCRLCHRVTDLTWVKIRASSYVKTPDEDCTPETFRLCGCCQTNYETGWNYLDLAIEHPTKVPNFNQMLYQAHNKRLNYIKRPHPYY